MTPDMNEPGNNHLRPEWEPHLDWQEMTILLHTVFPEWGPRAILDLLLRTESPLKATSAAPNLALFMEKVWEPLKANGLRSHPKPKEPLDGCQLCSWILGEVHEGWR